MYRYHAGLSARSGPNRTQGFILEDGSLLFLQLLFLGFLIFLNAFLTASEVALLSLKPNTVRRLGQEKGKRGRRAAALTENSGRFLATVQLGVTFAGFLASAFAALRFAAPLTGWLVELGAGFLSNNMLFGLSMILISVVLAGLFLVFGTLIPKQLGLRYAEPVALYSAGWIDFLSVLSAPFVRLLQISVNGILRLFGIKPEESGQVTEEEIRMMVDIGEENGAIESDEKRMIENVFEFNNTTAAEVMTHRTELVAVELDTSPEDVERILLNCGYSRVPVYREDIDDIIGFLHYREYLSAKLAGKAVPDISALLKPVFFAPETMRANLLFRNMQSRKVGMAVVLDEFGGTSGIVTVEDLLEEIVGSLYDEYDEPEVEIEQVSENVWRIDGAMRLDDIDRQLGLQLPDEEYDTIGGLVFGKLNAIPGVGSTVALPELGVKIRVEAVEERRVERVRLTWNPVQEHDMADVEI